jgi:hypothetical protein
MRFVQDNSVKLGLKQGSRFRYFAAFLFRFDDGCSDSIRVVIGALGGFGAFAGSLFVCFLLFGCRIVVFRADCGICRDD